MKKVETGRLRKGFTLIELLVVIAIIALLLAIVLPSLGLAKKKAQGIVCRANIRSLMTATILYADDHNGKAMAYGTNASGHWNLWVVNTAPYIGDMADVRYCPVTKMPDTLTGGDIFGILNSAWAWDRDRNASTKDDQETGSYAINGWFYTESRIYSPDPDKAFARLQDVRMTSRTPIFGDAVWCDAWPKETDTCPDRNTFDLSWPKHQEPGGSTNYMMRRFLTNRHGKYVNIGFVDGHQEDVDLDMLWTLKWNREFVTQGQKTRSDGTPIIQ